MSSPQLHLKPEHEIKLSDAASVVQPAGPESKHVTAMTAEMRKTGVDVVGDMPWGTHFCLFYETLMDLLEPLVSYCKAGPTQGQYNITTSRTGRRTQKTSLRWDVFLVPSIPAITSDLPPGEKQRPWPPISSTLISGERDAVLVDTPITVEQARALASWVLASGKNLTTIYASHGHGDHFFGTSTVLERFPGARSSRGRK